MMIDDLLPQLKELRETYGNIELDVLFDGGFHATMRNVAVRIDEFGDPIAVIPATTGRDGATEYEPGQII